MKTVMVGERRYRLPFVDLIPFDEEQNQRLGESINEAGAVLVPVMCWKEKKSATEDTVVDGANRILWASKHGILKVPVIYRSFDSEEEAKAECERVNADRRHMSPQVQEQLRRQRIERVAELRRKGESERAIAEQVGVSPGQVHRDLAKAVASGEATEPESGKITTKDGKKRDPVAIVCKRCKRLGTPVKNCAACEAERKKAAAKKKKAQTKKSDPGCDDFKNPIPAKLADVWNDPWIQSTFDFLCVWGEKFRDQRIPQGFAKRAKHFPFFVEKDFIDGCGFIMQYIDDLTEHIKSHRPAGVCPACQGEKCGACKMSGLVPRETYKELKSK